MYLDFDLSDESFEQADQMYKQMFRSETPTLASEVIEEIQLRVNEGEMYYGSQDPMQIFFEFTGVAYDPTLELYELCDYKGEGDGDYAIGEEALKLPIFRSKLSSYDMFL